MIRGSITHDGLDDVVTYFEKVTRAAKDLMPLAEEIGGIVHNDNMVARMAGVDRDNQPLQPLMESTIRRNPNRATETPLIPMEQASRPVSDFTLSYEQVTDSHVRVVGGWPDWQVVSYHATGTIHMAARDVVGVRSTAWGQVAAAFDRWTDSLAQGGAI